MNALNDHAFDESAEDMRWPQWFAAHYSDIAIPAYQGNPLIETLPPLLPRKHLIAQLQCVLPYDEAQRYLPAHVRIHFVTVVPNFFQPLLHHIELAETVGAMVRSGYVGRNPVHPGYLGRARDKLPSVLDYHPISVPLATPGLTLIGVSGAGKTRGIQQVLQLFPQLIVHSQYKDKLFPCMQLVYLKISCPHDGSRKALCQQFFRAVDECLGTSYFERFAAGGRLSVDTLLLHMANICVVHHIGVLVIDEIQNLREASAQDAAKMLNFFTQLDNEIKVPVVLIGTPRAWSMLTGGFRRARRAGGQGGFSWERMAYDKDWTRFLKSLWRYQYTRYPCKMTPELSWTLWNESQGVADIAIKLYCLTQARVIVRGTEQITREAIQETAQERLQFVQPFLRALRENDWYRLKTDPAFDDLVIPMDVTRRGGDTVSLQELGPNDFIDEDSAQAPADPNLPASPLDVESSDPSSDASMSPLEQGSGATGNPTMHDQPHPTPPAGERSTTGKQPVASIPGNQVEAETPKVTKRKKSTGSTTSVAQKGGLLHVFDSRPHTVAPYDALRDAGHVRPVSEYLLDTETRASEKPLKTDAQ